MNKYKEAIKSLKKQCNIYCPNDDCKDCYVVTAIEALQIADKLEQAKGELKYEYALINNWFMNKYDLNVEHTELETDALHFTGMIMQTIGYLLDALADIRGDNNGN